MTERRQRQDSRGGIGFGLAAYGLWGLMPLFFYLLRRVPPVEILGQRVVWCGLLLASILTLTGRWGELVRCLLSPLALAFLAYRGATAGLSLGAFDRTTDALLLATGVVTAVPLICFAEAARRLRLATLGFLQYIAPSMQFLLAVTVLGEPISQT